jgi:hypothetical protein
MAHDDTQAATPANEPPSSNVADIAAALPARQQTRNLICFSVITFLIYLSAPTLYVDVIHTTLCNKLGASKGVANLPSSAAIFFALPTLLLVWLVPHTRKLIPMLVGCFALTALIGVAVAVLLLTSGNADLLIAMLIAHGALAGLANQAAGIYRWEALARGVGEGRRGRTLSVAFGVGPLFAALANWMAQSVLNTHVPWLTYPRNFAFLFAYSVPVMVLAAYLCTRFELSYEQPVVKREPIVPYLFGGIWDFLKQRHFLILTVSFILVSMATYVMNNASLYAKTVLGLEPHQVAGNANVLRFGAKALCGLVLGALYARFGARAPVLMTAMLVNIAIVWTLTVKGHAYLAAFALFGGGELLGAYYYTYVVAGSPAALVKRNTAVLNLAYVVVAAGPYFLGRIADHFHSHPPSFKAGLAIAAVALALLLLIPARPERLLASYNER